MKPELMSVMVVEPNEDTRQLTCQFLEIHGYVVRGAGTAAECLAEARRRPPLVVVVALVLPDERGPGLIQRLRDALPLSGIIAVSSESSADEATTIMKNGADDYVGRPIVYTEMVTRVSRQMELAVSRFRQEAPEKRWMIGPYEVIRTLNRGAMGNLLEAERDGMLYAIKTLGRPQDAGFVKNTYRQRFLRSAVVGTTLDHPNIATVFDIGEEGEHNLPYVVMKRVEGETLDLYKRHNPDLTIKDRMRLVRDIALALGALHENRILVRTVAPASVVVTPGGRAVMIDFLYAHMPASDLTTTGDVAGVPEYMAPECFTSRRITFASDVFSLGCLTYELLLNRKPFFGATLAMVMAEIITTKPLRPRTLEPDLPPSLEVLLGKMLRKDPRHRLRTMNELVVDIDSYLNGQVIKQDQGLATRFLQRDWT